MECITLGHILNTLNVSRPCLPFRVLEALKETPVTDIYETTVGYEALLAALVLVDVAGHSMLVTAVTLQPIPNSNPIKYTVRIKVTD